MDLATRLQTNDFGLSATLIKLITHSNKLNSVFSTVTIHQILILARNGPNENL